MTTKYIVSVDVGTSSVRVALINIDGKIMKKTIREINIWNPEPEHYEQSSDDIWNGVCFCIKVNTNLCSRNILFVICLILLISLIYFLYIECRQ